MNFEVLLTHWTDRREELVTVYAESIHGALCAAVEGRNTVYKVEVLDTKPVPVEVPVVIPQLIEVPHMTA
jgi:hypothetical protein